MPGDFLWFPVTAAVGSCFIYAASTLVAGRLLAGREAVRHEHEPLIHALLAVLAGSLLPVYFFLVLPSKSPPFGAVSIGWALYVLAFGLLLARTLYRTLSSMMFDVRRTWAGRQGSFLLTVSLILIPLAIGGVSLVAALGFLGLDLTQVLLATGVVGIVLGFALQDTISSVFAWYGLLADEAFLEGDIVMLQDGRICRVDNVGYRTTRFYCIGEHSIIYVPNAQLSSEAITNSSRPTVDLRLSIQIGVSYDPNIDLKVVAKDLRTIARSHPNVLCALGEKLEIAKSALAMTGEASDATEWNNLIKRIEAEQRLDDRIDAFAERMKRTSQQLDDLKGPFPPLLMTPPERFRLARQQAHGAKEFLYLVWKPHDVPSIDDDLRAIWNLVDVWVKCSPPFADGESDYKNAQFDRAFDKLKQSWNEHRDLFRRTINGTPRKHQARVCRRFAAWIRDDFKPKVGLEKNPMVTWVAFADSAINLSLVFYVDDIRLNHYMRRERTIMEIASEIKRVFDLKEGTLNPYPQSEIRIKGPVVVTHPAG